MLSIIIPARNEESRIGDTLQAYGSFFARELPNHEIFVIINNSTDNTLGVVRQHQIKFPRIRYIDINPPGKGLAIIEGFKKSFGDYVGFVDADMSTSPRDFYELYQYKGNIALLIATVPKKIIFPIRFATAYCPAISGLKNLFAKIISILCMTNIANKVSKTGLLYSNILEIFADFFFSEKTFFNGMNEMKNAAKLPINIPIIAP